MNSNVHQQSGQRTSSSEPFNEPRTAMTIQIDSKRSANAELRGTDAALTSCFIERFLKACELGQIKTSLREPVRDDLREKEVLSRILMLNCRHLSAARRRSIFVKIMAITRRLQQKLVSAGLGALDHAQLLARKLATRSDIDRLDSEIVRLLDRRIELAEACGVLRFSQGVGIYEEHYINSVRTMICGLSACSDIKQCTWEIFCKLFDIRVTFVPMPFEAKP